jgi:protein TonB
MPAGVTRILPFAVISAALHAAVMVNVTGRLEIAVTPGGDTGPVAVRLVPTGATTPDPAAPSGAAGSVPGPTDQRQPETAETAAAGQAARKETPSADQSFASAEQTASGYAPDATVDHVREEVRSAGPKRKRRATATHDREEFPEKSRTAPDRADESEKAVADAANGPAETARHPEKPVSSDTTEQAVEPETTTSTRSGDADISNTVTESVEGDDQAPERDTTPDKEDTRQAGERSGADGADDRAQLASRARERVQVHFRERFRYPRIARQRGWEGRVVLEFRIQPDGRITDVEVTASSGRSILDENARRTLIHIQRVPELAHRVGRQPLELEVPVTYRLQPA